jgi:LysM repeat protein
MLFRGASPRLTISLLALVLAGCNTPTPTLPWASEPEPTGTLVVAGDTVCHVAGRLGVSADALARANGLPSVSARLIEGARLEVPEDAPIVYTVRRGDTLSGIGRWTGLPVPHLAEENALPDPNRLAVGQQLRVSAGALTACAPEPPTYRVARVPTTPQPAPIRFGGPVTAAVSSPPPADGSNPKASFARSVAAQARRLYEQADFEGAADVARSAPDWDGLALDDPVRKAGSEAGLYEGLALAGLGQDDEARAAFARSRAADPSVRLPEALASPPVRQLFDEAAPQTVAGTEP